MKNRLNTFIAIIIATGILAGCDGGTLGSEGYKAPNRPWEDAPMTHICNEQQMRRVETEHLFCKTNTTYFNSYCYGSAIMRNCKLKEDVK